MPPGLRHVLLAAARRGIAGSHPQGAIVRPSFTASSVQHLHNAYVARARSRQLDAQVRQALRPEHPPSPTRTPQAQLQGHRHRI